MTFTGWRRVACAAALLGAAQAQAELPVETLTMAQLPPPDAYRLYLGDPAMNHLLDGRTHVIDGASMRYLGMVGTGFAGAVTTSRDGRSLYVATTYLSRLQRGTRTDVVEVYGTDDLVLRHEIEIPPKHAQSLPMRALLATTADDRFLLVQNATPATSVTVVDLANRRPATEIPTPGCYGVIPWPGQPRRFSTVCGDGTLASFDLDEQGQLAARGTPVPFFDADKDPVFMHYELVGDRLVLLSYAGQVHAIDLAGEQAKPQAPWPLADAAAVRQKWQPGGYQLFTIEPRTGRLFVGMHRGAREGSHKNPADEIWVVDLASRQRVSRLPGRTAVALAIARTEQPRLFVLSGADNRILSFDAAPTAQAGAKVLAPAAFKPRTASAPVGETPVYLGLR